jgi:hypothetical protein
MRQSLLWAIALLSTVFLGNAAVIATPDLFLKLPATAEIAQSIAQGGFPKMVPVEVDKPFQLKLNSRAMLKRGGLTLKFLKVKEDSRCPTGVDCVWAGRATVVVHVTKNGKSFGNVELTRSATQSTRKSVAGYSLQLVDLSPHPAAGQTSAPSNYVGSFLISRPSKAPI